ncbi:hypothetical protein SAMN05421688_3289 [Poseidonocella pacifica]|uniref:Malonate transporter n=1 Tax=Poseidonocella pacifica TaxID=871651 RepID=A0A1I0YTJ2_9RHOB|nr:AEC family transporter [Poseidonocella pacifica]SFB15740.1 hypothetical protein SAMN05421688_3289 [Poseidonocella pacifica]
MQALIEVILPVFLLIGFGYVTAWKGLFTDNSVQGLMSFTQQFAIPCLLFRAISRLDLTQHFDLRLLGAFYLAALICFFAGLFGARIFFKRDWEDCVAIGFCALFSNSLLLGVPITERAFGTDALAGNYAIIAIHSPFGYALGITAMEIARAKRSGTTGALLPKVLSAMFRNALIIGVMAGLIVNLAGIPIHVTINDAVDLMARSALPAALFGLGGVLVRYKPEGDFRTIAMVCAISLLVHPGLVWVFSKAASLPTEAFRSAIITSAMAPGINAFVFANMYGRAKRVAASSVLIATAVSLLSVTFWLTMLGR